MLENEKVAVATETQTAHRLITIVTTVGEKIKITFYGNEWAELKSLLQDGGEDSEGKSFQGYNLSNMKCVESLNRTTLEHPKAIVPEGNFNLFMMPYKSKSGVMSRSEIYNKIKEFIADDGDSVKDHFSKDGKNYTQILSSDLEDMIESYQPGTKEAVDKEKAEATSDIVKSVKKAIAENNSYDIRTNLSGLSNSEKLDLIIELLLEVKSFTTPITSKEKDKIEEDKKLDIEMKEMGQGFDDLGFFN